MPTADPARRPVPRRAGGMLTVDVAALLGPDLGARAACKGLAPLHDAAVAGETDEQRSARHVQAQAVCEVCPVLAACGAARRALGRQAASVWAGVVPDGRTVR